MSNVVEVVSGVQGYEQGLNARRMFWESSATMQALLDPDASQDLVYLTYIYYCALGPHITKPVEGWIYRAGERCEEIGMSDLGIMLRKHSVHEKNHEQMMIKDTHSLVARWNELHPVFPLDADRLLALPETEATRNYCDLHEDTIIGDSPYAQIAIEYEIERLSVVLGPRLLDHVAARCGPDFINRISFLSEHVRIDVVHTELNHKTLDSFLLDYPGTLDDLVDVGINALDCYMAFFKECLVLASDRHREMVS